jgi:hypothetical protein
MSIGEGISKSHDGLVDLTDALEEVGNAPVIAICSLGPAGDMGSDR